MPFEIVRNDITKMAVDAIAKALCSLDAVQEVRFLVDGDFARRYGTADVSKVYMD